MDREPHVFVTMQVKGVCKQMEGMRPRFIQEGYMSDQVITEMNYEAFEALIDNYIDRVAEKGDDMPASTFFELLFERAAQQVTETVEVEGELVNNQLVLRVPAGTESAIQVKGNEILVGKQRIIVKLKNKRPQHSPKVAV